MFVLSAEPDTEEDNEKFSGLFHYPSREREEMRYALS